MQASSSHEPSHLKRTLGLPSVLFGVGLPDENAHAPNEKLDVGNFQGGIIASAYLYDEISRIAVHFSTVSERVTQATMF